jgi:hypothetical protein
MRWNAQWWIANVRCSQLNSYSVGFDTANGIGHGGGGLGADGGVGGGDFL